MSHAVGGAQVPGSATRTDPSGWAAGWAAFAGIMMSVVGMWWVIAGLVALFDDGFYVVTQEWIFQFDLTTWGWIHMGVGVIMVAAGLGIFTGAIWARVIGVAVAALAMLIAFAWLPYYPVWALMFIVGSVAVMWALTAHGRDITEV